MAPRLPLLLIVAIILFGALADMNAAAIMDDAYMFVRYADHIAAFGTPSWNPGGEATYGVTSLLHLLLVFGWRLLLDNPAVAVGMASATAGILFLVLLAWLLHRHVALWPSGLPAWIIAYGSLALAIDSFGVHFSTGMDTATAWAYLTGYMVVWGWYVRHPSGWSIAGTGMLGGAAFAARPDLLLFSCGLPLARLVLGPARSDRRSGAGVLLLTGLAAASLALGAGVVAGSPLPLAFFAKSLRLYGESFYAQYRLVGIDQSLSFVASFWYLWLLPLADWLLQRRDGRRRPDPTEAGLFAAAVLFVAYYALFATQVMPYQQRFLYPVLPALLFVGARASVRLWARLPEGLGSAHRDAVQRGIAMAVLVGALFPAAVDVARSFSSRQVRGELFDYDLFASYQRRYTGYWHRLDAVTRLPDDVVVATTEVGLPAAMNPGKTIIDLTGLNDTMIAHRGFSADYVLNTLAPDLIYLPHLHYTRMRRELMGHPTFGKYEHRGGALLGTEMGIAVRRDSRHYAALVKALLAQPD